jgi:hypothetical protein
MSELPPVQPESPDAVAGDAAPDNVVPFPGSLEDLAARLAAAEAKAAAAPGDQGVEVGVAVQIADGHPLHGVAEVGPGGQVGLGPGGHLHHIEGRAGRRGRGPAVDSAVPAAFLGAGK